jgi:transketolase C-terminal domain/subunit
LRVSKPKYIRLDSKPVQQIYPEDMAVALDDGFHELEQGAGVCVVATGFMTQVARKALAQTTAPVGLVDLFSFAPLNEAKLLAVLSRYERVVTVEEGFIHRGGLDALITGLLAKGAKRIPVRALGVDDRFIYDVGNRPHLHKLAGMDEESILKAVAAPAA